MLVRKNLWGWFKKRGWNYLACGLGMVLVLEFYPVLRFSEEQIDIHIYPDHVTVDGYYLLENPVPVPSRQELYYPLPHDPGVPEGSVRLIQQLSPERKELPRRMVAGQHRMTVSLSPNGQSLVRTVYDQPAPQRRARYILETTQDWGRPLRYGLYRMFTHGVTLEHSNYPVKPYPGGFLGFEKENFMPQEDWTFSWKEKDNE